MLSFALQLWRRDEVLDAVVAHGVAELRVTELRRADPLLLLLDPAAALQGQPHRPFEVLVRNLPAMRPGRAASTDPQTVLLTAFVSRPDSAPPR